MKNASIWSFFFFNFGLITFFIFEFRFCQGEVQGPFTPAEMAEWCKQGYFTANLMVRRSCDERYTTLGELITLCGRVPFKPGPPIPPLKVNFFAMFGHLLNKITFGFLFTLNWTDRPRQKLNPILSTFNEELDFFLSEKSLVVVLSTSACFPLHKKVWQVIFSIILSKLWNLKKWVSKSTKTKKIKIWDILGSFGKTVIAKKMFS